MKIEFESEQEKEIIYNLLFKAEKIKDFSFSERAIINNILFDIGEEL